MNFPCSAMHIVLALGFLLVNAASTVADDTDPAVSLILSAVSAEQRSDDTLFRCEVTIINDTKNALAVFSNFYSPFDGLELVVTDVDGRILKQQPYTFHQSPFTHKGREIPLQHGKTQTSMVFPLSRFGKIGQQLKIRLVGTLPGSTYKKILSTETLRVVVSKSAKSNEITKP